MNFSALGQFDSHHNGSHVSSAGQSPSRQQFPATSTMNDMSNLSPHQPRTLNYANMSNVNNESSLLTARTSYPTSSFLSNGTQGTYGANNNYNNNHNNNNNIYNRRGSNRAFDASQQTRQARRTERILAETAREALEAQNRPSGANGSNLMSDIPSRRINSRTARNNAEHDAFARKLGDNLQNPRRMQRSGSSNSDDSNVNALNNLNSLDPRAAMNRTHGITGMAGNGANSSRGAAAGAGAGADGLGGIAGNAGNNRSESLLGSFADNYGSGASNFASLGNMGSMSNLGGGRNRTRRGQQGGIQRMSTRVPFNPTTSDANGGNGANSENKENNRSGRDGRDGRDESKSPERGRGGNAYGIPATPLESNLAERGSMRQLAVARTGRDHNGSERSTRSHTQSQSQSESQTGSSSMALVPTAGNVKDKCCVSVIGFPQGDVTFVHQKFCSFGKIEECVIDKNTLNIRYSNADEADHAMTQNGTWIVHDHFEYMICVQYTEWIEVKRLGTGVAGMFAKVDNNRERLRDGGQGSFRSMGEYDEGRGMPVLMRDDSIYKKMYHFLTTGW